MHAPNDPRLSTLVQIWFSAFGSRHRKVKDLLRESPAPLLELFLRFGHARDDRHQISPQHLGMFLASLVRGPPIMGFQMTSREMNRQATFSLVESDAVPTNALVARPGKPFTVQHSLPAQSAPVPISDTISDEHVMEYGLRLARNDLADAVRSQDFALIKEAEERLTLVAAAIDRASWSPGDWHRYFGNKGRLWLR